MRQSGFTLWELLVSVAVLVVLATIALPSLSALQQKNQLTSAKNALMVTLNLARSEAIVGTRPVIVCPLSSPTTCEQRTDWSRGWLAYRDDNRNGRLDPVERVLSVYELDNARLRVRTSDGRRKLTYRSMGRSEGSNVRFVFCVEGSSEYSGQVVVANTGRARTVGRAPAGACG